MVPPPSREVRQRALDRLEAMMPYSKWEIPEDAFSAEHILRCVRELLEKNGKSNPGAIFTRAGLLTNNDVVAAIGLEGLVLAVLERIKEYEMAWGDQAKWKVADPIRIFQKREPHKMKKVHQKRWRLIWGVSLIDQCVDRALWSTMLDNTMKHADLQPMKPGYSFRYGGVNKMVRRYGRKNSTQWRSFDRSGHDFTVAGWQLDDNFELDNRLCLTQFTNASLFSRWQTIAVARHQALNYGSFVFSNGVVCRKVLPGIQASGALKTIDGNCKTVLADRVYYDISKGMPSDPEATIAMGDDTVEDGIADVNDFVEWQLKNRGRVVTIESEAGLFHEQNFCSMKFRQVSGPESQWVSVPLNFNKSAYGLYKMEKSQVQYLADTLDNLCTEYVFHPRFGDFVRLLHQVDSKRVRSIAAYQNIHTGYEAAC